jgi:hypothetical protein
MDADYEYDRLTKLLVSSQGGSLVFHEEDNAVW